MRKPITTSAIRQRKLEHQRITMLTAYDYPMARILDEAGVDMLLVGDSLGNVVLGYDSTLPVTMEDMLHHTKAVRRGTTYGMVVADMPFMSYQVSVAEALTNAGRLFKEAGAQAVKIEGGQEIADTVAAMTRAGMPVVGHVGLTPQHVHQLGGYKVQGKDTSAAQKLVDDAKALEASGAFAVVLECVPEGLAARVTELVSIPTIGIGAGPHCDGQVLVINDMLNLYPSFTPKFVKKYANIHQDIVSAVASYITEVQNKGFPATEHSFNDAGLELSKLY